MVKEKKGLPQTLEKCDTERGFFQAHPKVMDRVQEQSTFSGALVHAVWFMVRCKTLPVAIPQYIPNDFSCLDLALVQLTCRSASNCRFKGQALAARAASGRASGTGRNRPSPRRESAWPPSHGGARCRRSLLPLCALGPQSRVI